MVVCVYYLGQYHYYYNNYVFNFFACRCLICATAMKKCNDRLVRPVLLLQLRLQQSGVSFENTYCLYANTIINNNNNSYCSYNFTAAIILLLIIIDVISLVSVVPSLSIYFCCLTGHCNGLHECIVHSSYNIFALLYVQLYTYKCASFSSHRKFCLI